MTRSREPLGRLERGLPAAWYYDAAHFARELEACWYGQWLAVAREEQLPAPGDFRVADIGTQSILIVRDEGGALRAFHNTCRHRGSILATQPQGSWRGQRIVCPYHGWTYSLDGRLTATPQRMPTADFDGAALSLHAVALDCWGGWIFVNLTGGNASPLARSLGDLPAELERYDLGDLRLGKRIVLDIRANWKVVCENFAECYHCPTVHPELCRVVTAYRDAGAWGLHRDASGSPQPEARAEFAPGAATLTLDGRSTLAPFPRLNEAERQRPYLARELRPNLFLNIHPDYVHSHMMFPTGAESVRMVYDWLFEPRALADPAFDLARYVELWEITNRQDARNCEWQQRGMHALPFESGCYVPQEFDAYRFAQWVRKQLEGL